MSITKKLYNLDEIRSIPILDVCDFLGLKVERHGRNYWCKVRPENKASVILHTDTNYFYDFGNREHGNNIALVQYTCGGISTGEAIRKLGKAFNISPSIGADDLLAKPLNSWEYKKIGLHGDLATKNLVFPVTTASIEELLDMSYGYSMTMNELQKRDPEAYRWIIRNKAIPYVENKREAYFLSVWNHYDFLRSFGRHIDFFDSDKTISKFESETKDLEQAERALFKACRGCDIEMKEPEHYDPLHVLSLLQQGRLLISIGPERCDEIIAASNLKKEDVCESTMSYDEYCSYIFDNHPHSAVFEKEKVTITYPESDKQFFDQLYSFPEANRPSLNFIISSANKRTEKITASDKGKLLENVH